MLMLLSSGIEFSVFSSDLIAIAHVSFDSDTEKCFPLIGIIFLFKLSWINPYINHDDDVCLAVPETVCFGLH